MFMAAIQPAPSPSHYVPTLHSGCTQSALGMGEVVE